MFSTSLNPNLVSDFSRNFWDSHNQNCCVWLSTTVVQSLPLSSYLVTHPIMSIPQYLHTSEIRTPGSKNKGTTHKLKPSTGLYIIACFSYLTHCSCLCHTTIDETCLCLGLEIIKISDYMTILEIFSCYHGKHASSVIISSHQPLIIARYAMLVCYSYSIPSIWLYLTSVNPELL